LTSVNYFDFICCDFVCYEIDQFLIVPVSFTHDAILLPSKYTGEAKPGRNLTQRLSDSPFV